MLDSNFWKNYFEVYDFLNLLPPYQELLSDICQALEIKKGEKILEAGNPCPKDKRKRGRGNWLG